MEALDANNFVYFSKIPLLIKQLEGESRVFVDRAFDLSIAYPLMARSRWELSWANSLQWGQGFLGNEDRFFPFLFYQPASWSNYVQHEGKLQYSFARKYPNAYSFYRKRALELSYDVMAQSYSTYLNGKIMAYWSAEFGKEWFITLNGRLKTRLWSKGLQPLLFEADGKGISSYIELRQSIEDILQLDFQLLKVVNQSYYPLRLPFSIRRWAPLAGLSFLFYQPAGVKNRLSLSSFLTSKPVNTSPKVKNRLSLASFLTPFVGAEWEISLLEVIILRFRVYGECNFNLSIHYHRPVCQLDTLLTSAL